MEISEKSKTDKQFAEIFDHLFQKCQSIFQQNELLNKQIDIQGSKIVEIEQNLRSQLVY